MGLIFCSVTSTAKVQLPNLRDGSWQENLLLTSRDSNPPRTRSIDERFCLPYRRCSSG